VSGPKIEGQFMNFGLESNGGIDDEEVDVIQTADRRRPAAMPG
jgi:hypothetical protein